jgi:hypothetical protein
VIEFLITDVLKVLLQVVLIDLVLAGDNAGVIGLAAAGRLLQAQEASPAKRSPKRVGRLSWPTFPCRSTMSWPSQGRHASIQWS